MNFQEVNRGRKQARALYLELRALGVDIRLEELDAIPGREMEGNYAVGIRGLKSLAPAHADQLRQRAKDDRAGLAQVILLSCMDGDLRAIKAEGVA